MQLWKKRAPPAKPSYGTGNGRVDPGELRRLLINRARKGELITYGEVAAAFGEQWHQGFGSSLKRALDLLGAENKAAGEPLLMVLVVNKNTRQPGAGFYAEIGAVDPEPRAQGGAARG